MIHFLKNQEIDMSKWDDCIGHSFNGIFYAYSWYLDMVSPGWVALVENDYESVMPLPIRKKWGVAYIYQPFFVQQLGIFSRVSVSSEVTARFVAAIPGRFRFADINLNTFNSLDSFSGITLQRMRTYELDLIQSYPEIRKGYSVNTARNLKKAEKTGVFVARQGRPEEIIAAFRQHRGRTLKSFSGNDYNVLKHLIYAGIHKGMVHTYSAYTAENNFCAGAIFYRSHKKVVFLFSAITDEGKASSAMYMIVDHFIKEHAAKELILDFEGSNDPGLARFYSSFGSKECVFLRLQMNRLPCVLKPLAQLYTRLKTMYYRST